MLPVRQFLIPLVMAFIVPDALLSQQASSGFPIQGTQQAPVKVADLLQEAEAPRVADAAGGTEKPGGEVPAAAEVAPAQNSFHLLDMLMKADLVIMAVMGILALASLWCWTIIFNKLTRISRLNGHAETFEESFWSGGSLDQLFDRLHTRAKDPMTAVFVAGMREWRRSTVKGALASDLRASLQQRIERGMQVVIDREIETLEKDMGFLASVGSTAPFVGLFGTIWGIMNSFQSIAASQNTSLAVVAPGIAEALFVTAMGFITAIPAVLAYNKLSADIHRFGGRLDMFVHEFIAIVSRQLEERV